MVVAQAKMEVRSFEGSPEQLSQFVVSAWKSSYAGAVAVPNWSPEYFRWQLQMDRPQHRQNLLAAYEGGRLAGVLLYFPRLFELQGQQIMGAHATWLSVHADFRRRGVGDILQAAAMKRSQEQGIQFHAGYVYYGSRKSIGPEFWLKSKRRSSAGQTVGPSLGFHARTLNAGRVAEWSVNPTEQILASACGPFIPDPKIRAAPGASVRPFRDTDTDRCVELASRSTQKCDLRLLWDHATLKHHLTGLGRCLVYERNGQVDGFIAWHSLFFSGRTDERVGIIDLVCVSELSRRAASSLLNAALVELKQQGAIVALKLRSGDYPRFLFSRWGWYPAAAQSHVLLSWSGKRIPVPAIRRSHLLWR